MIGSQDMEILAKVLAEMEEEQGSSFSLESVNIAELQRRTGIPRQKLRTLKKNGFKTKAHGNAGKKREETVITLYEPELICLMKDGVVNSSVCFERLKEIGYAGGLTTVNQGGLSFSCSAIHSICIYTGGSVTINSNIGAGGDYPIYVVRASGDINIAEGVSNIEAWLISDGGTINTCAGKNSIEDLSHSTCNTQLTIDGPVYGSSLKLMRTGGANGVTRNIGSARESDAESAETINYPAKTYVWSYEESTSSDVRLYESGSIELAPRV